MSYPLLVVLPEADGHAQAPVDRLRDSALRPCSGWPSPVASRGCPAHPPHGDQLPLFNPRLLRLANAGMAGRWFARLRADRPLISPSGDLCGEAPGTERGDDQAAAHVGGIRLGVAWRAERH